MIKFHDISEWQDGLNLSKLKNKKAFILRSSWSGINDHNQYKDKNFEDFYKQAKDLNAYVGAYHYSTARNADEALKEAKYFLSVLKGKQFELPVFIDFEDTQNHGNLTSSECQSIIKTFCDFMEKNGFFVGVYSMASWLDIGNKAYSPDYYMWIASWGSNDGNINVDYSNTEMDILQFTSNYTDCNMRLDTNILYDESIVKTIKEKGFNGFSKSNTSATIEFKVGDKVIVINPIDYDTGVQLTCYDENYTIIELKGKRAVLSARNQIFAAINTDNLKKA